MRRSCLNSAQIKEMSVWSVYAAMALILLL